MARGLLRESVARAEDRADDAVHAVRPGFFLLLVAQRTVGERHEVEDFGAERIAFQGVVSHRDHRFQRGPVGFVGVDARGQHQHFVQIGVHGQRLVFVAVGVSVVEVVVILVGQRLVARVVAHHQRGVVERGLGVHRPVEDHVLVGDSGGGQRRNQQ